MISKYLTHACRGFVYNRLYTIINIAGLVLSLAGCIIIARYVHQELTVDDYLPALDRTMVAYELLPNGEKIRTECSNMNNLKDYPTPQFSPEVEIFTQFMPYDGALIELDNGLSDNFNILATDSSFLDIIPRRILQGVRMDKLNEAMVTESVATRLWPDKDPLDQTLKIYGDPNVYKVVGVLEDADCKRNFDYDMILNVDKRDLRTRKIGWMVCRLNPGVDYKQFNSSIRPYEFNHEKMGYVEHAHPQLMPLKDTYFDSSFIITKEDVFQINGNLHNVRILEIVAVLLLIVGIFNFLNIYSIVMHERQQAFAIRKSFGAAMKDIFLHIFTENFLIAVVSLGLAWLLIFGATPLLREYVNMTLIPSPRFDVIITATACVGLPLAVSLVTTYGIWRNAKVHSMGNSTPTGAIRLRRYLLLLPQMTITLILISVSVYFMLQVRYMLNANYGFQTHSIVTFRLWPTQGREANYNITNWEEYRQKRKKEYSNIEQAMKAIEAIPGVESSTTVYEDDHPTLLQSGFNINKARLLGNPNNEWHDFMCAFIDKPQLETYNVGIAMIDTAKVREAKYYYVLLNKEALELLAVPDTAAAILETQEGLFYSMGMGPDDAYKYNIAGELGDVRLGSFTMQNYPLAIFVDTGDYERKTGKPLVRYKEENKTEVLAALTKVYQSINGKDSVPEFEFVEDEIAHTYADDVRAAHVYISFASLAILISCLGLFGVVSYDLRRRHRELRIRRVLGAKKHDIIRLILKPYLLIITLASAIAMPAALYAIHIYRSSYSSSLNASPWIFIGAIVVITIISYTTVVANVASIDKKQNSWSGTI